jgi:tetratricopeptide (TPR) repeat protein
VLGRHEEAIATLQNVLSLNPNFLTAHAQLAAAYSESGREEEARTQVAEVLKLNPRFSVEILKQRIPYKDPREVERYVNALRKAGLK